ncbi:MAG: membrane dipeptidase [Myxococcota bacterium]|jgi:membrane dipeptidase
MKIAFYALTVSLFLAVCFFLLGKNVERLMNRVVPVDLPVVSDRARTLHASSFVVDLHSDTSLTGRPILDRSKVGHVDWPRMEEGGVGLQFFTAPTKVPISLDIHRTDANAPDVLSLLDFAKHGPFYKASPYRRGMLQGEQVRHAVELSEGALVLIRTRRDLEALIDGRANNSRAIGALLGLEGAHALQSKVKYLERFYDAGVRMIGLTHFFDNDFAGSAHGVERGGLTDLGRDLVRRLIDYGIMIDLAHLSPAAIDDVLAMVDVPTVVSHTGVKGTCDNPRNLSDEHIRAIANGGGVIGIGYFELAVCGTAPKDIVAAMLHVVGLVGDDHVALGSDYDGAVTVAFDTSQLQVLTQTMIDAELSDESIRKILGGNIVRVMREVLPD